MNFCNHCAAPVEQKIPNLDDKHRYCCTKCKKIHYENPKPIVGILPIYQNKILLCQRAIEPQKYKWTIPAGFMENGETAENGALREAQEEAGITVKLKGLHAIYSIPKISQVYLTFLGEMTNDSILKGHETLDTKFVSIDEIPWKDLAFESIKFVLKRYYDDQKKGTRQVHSNHT